MMRSLICLLLLLCIPLPPSYAQEFLARKILAMYDSRVEKEPTSTFVHQICEMPLNFLGVDVIYHNINDPLPDLTERHDIRGILTCFPHEMHMADPIAYLQWAEQVIALGKKYVILFNPGFKKNSDQTYTPDYLVNSFYQKLGLYDRNNWVQYTFDYQIASKDSSIVDFEHPYPSPLPPFNSMDVIDPAVTSFLKVTIPDSPQSESHLIVTGPHGSYVAEYYASTYIKEEQAPEERYWYLNPFQFFKIAFDLENLPIPDPTTLAGRRIYYSQIDGDSFNSVSQIENYAEDKLPCAQVIYKEVLLKYPQLPVSVAIIGADISPTWVGTVKAQEIVKKILALDHVEIGTHTFSHPFDWAFFKDPDQQKKEIEFLYLYPYGSWQSSYLSWLRSAYYLQTGKVSLNETGLGIGYVTPRAYANHPFDLLNEIQGSVNYIKQFIPVGKQVKLIQWTGNCLPWDQPIRLAYDSGLQNINGGRVQKDADNPSYTNVRSLGRHVGDQIQIYASANNEDDYTENWTDRFYGFKYVINTFINCESPRRIKAMDLYYHFYSGEREASLKALISNLEYILRQAIIPVWTSRYCQVAKGFYTTEIKKLDSQKWQFFRREGLQTIRFDIPNTVVDYAHSEGVIGHQRYQDSLYVYLDSQHEAPTIALGEGKNEETAYLIESRWEISNLKRSPEKITFKAQGWGALEMLWKLPGAGKYSLRAIDQKGVAYATDGRQSQMGVQSFSLNAPHDQLLFVELVKGGQ